MKLYKKGVRNVHCTINFKVTKRLDLNLAFDVSLQLPFVSFASILSQLWDLIFYQTF